LLQKILLHRELADLGVQFLDPCFFALLVLWGFAGEPSSYLLLGLLLSLGNLVGIHAVLAGVFGQGVYAGQGIQSHAGLKLGGEFSSLPGHQKPPSGFLCPP
jgi:hypothetical protein